MATKIGRAPLANAYRKAPRQVRLVNLHAHYESEGREQVDFALAPVLYHGTIKYTAQHWTKNGVLNTSLSLANRPDHAALYASYALDPYSGSDLCYGIKLRSATNRIIQLRSEFATHFGLGREFEEIMGGNIIQALAFFDRDLLLAGRDVHFGVTYEPDAGGGILVQQGVVGYPSSPQKLAAALFASLEYNITTREASFTIFNQDLWNENFIIPPPSLENFERLVPRRDRRQLALPSGAMYVIAKMLFRD